MLQDMNNNLKAMVNGHGGESYGWGMMWATQPAP